MFDFDEDNIVEEFPVKNRDRETPKERKARKYREAEKHVGGWGKWYKNQSAKENRRNAKKISEEDRAEHTKGVHKHKHWYPY